MINVLSYDISWRLKNIHNKDSKDKYVKMYRRHRETGNPKYVNDTLEIYKDSTMKLFLECMLLSGFDVDECVEFFNCDPKAITFYQKMYFDIEPIKGSTAKLLMIANSGKPSEVSLKLCAVKFGKQFIRWFIGLDDRLDEEFLDRMKGRLTDGVIVKSLGHELTSSTSTDMNMYLKMISLVKDKDDNNKLTGSIKNIVDHFAKILDNRNLEF